MVSTPFFESLRVAASVVYLRPSATPAISPYVGFMAYPGSAATFPIATPTSQQRALKAM
jgi:hypothetical protein